MQTTGNICPCAESGPQAVDGEVGRAQVFDLIGHLNKP